MFKCLSVAPPSLNENRPHAHKVSCCCPNSVWPPGGASDHTQIVTRASLNWPLCSHVCRVAASQVPEPSGDVHRHGRGVGHLPGVVVGRREQSGDQQPQEAESHGLRGRRHGRQLHVALHAGQRHGLHDGHHFTPGLWVLNIIYSCYCDIIPEGGGGGSTLIS